MRTNRVSGKSARSVLPPASLADEMIFAGMPGWRSRLRAARTGSVAAVVAGILGGAGLAAAPAYAQTAPAGAQATAAGAPTS